MQRNDKNAGNCRVKDGVATWSLKSDLGVSSAEDVHGQAKKLAQDVRIMRVRVQLPSKEGVSLATYQILRSLQTELESQDKSIEFDGVLAPLGGRAW